MNDLFKKIAASAAKLWANRTLAQKLAAAGVAAAAIAAFVLIISVSAEPSTVAVIDTPVTDEAKRDAIVTRINAEGVRAQVSASGIISVPDEESARRMRAILIREDLVPGGTDPWALFDRDRWTATDFERNINLRRSITAMVTEHIKALSEIDDADVAIQMPERTLFASDQRPVTASVVIRPRPGSGISSDRKKIEGLQKLIQFAVEGLEAENITILDYNGSVLNDFAGSAETDRLALIERENRIKRDIAAKYRADILRNLQSTFGSDRVRDLNITVDMDFTKRTVEAQRIIPTVVRERTPGVPWDDSETVPSLTLDETASTTTWKGAASGPAVPDGGEAGEVTQETRTRTDEVSREQSSEERSPAIDRISVSVNIDGTWERKQADKDADGGKTAEREYKPVPPEQLEAARALIKGAIGFNEKRGDIVEVTNIQFDRSAQFEAEIEATAASVEEQRRTRLTVTAACGLALLLALIFGLFQAGLKSKRLREAALAREHERLREEAERSVHAAAAENGLPVSEDEKARNALAAKAADLVRENPLAAANLVKTWIAEG